MNGENEELKAIKCGDCGGDLVKSFRVEYDDEEEESVNIPVAKCVACGHEYDQHTQEYYEVFADDLTYDKDNTVFKLGLKGVINDVEYEIVGRIRYQEEDEYEKSTWDEWFSVSSDGVYHYFVEEEGKVHSYKEYIPESIDLDSYDDRIEFEGKSISKSEGYIGRIVYAEGELSWEPEIGEPVTMYDIKKDGNKYSIEQSEGEVSISKGERIPYEDIIEAFGDEEAKDLFEKTTKKRKEYNRKSLVYLIVFIIIFSLSVYSCLSTSPVKGVMKGRNDITNNEMKIEEGKRAYSSQTLYGPFAIDKGNSLYNVDVSINEAVQRLNREWQSFRLMLIKEERLIKAVNNQFNYASLKALFNEIEAKKEPVEGYLLSGDFWDEHGYDSDGSWHENSLSVDDDFVLDDAGKYYIYLDLFSKNPRSIASVKVKLERVKSYRYYVILMFLIAVLMIINRSKSKSYNALPFDVASE